MHVKGLQLLSNVGFGHGFTHIFQHQAHASILREWKDVKTHDSLASRDQKAPIVDRKPSTMSGTSTGNSPLISPTSVLEDLARIKTRNLRVFSPQTHTEFCYVVPQGEGVLVHLGAWSGASRRVAHWCGHVTVAPEEVRLYAAS